MPFLLMVFLTLVCLPEVGDDGDYYAPPWQGTPGLSSVLTWLGVAVTVLYAYQLSRRTCRALEHDPLRREHTLRCYERGRFRHQILLFGAYLLSLCVFGWGWAVGQFWRLEGETLLPAPELLILAPFLVAQVFSWAFFYDAERASHRSTRHPLPLDPRPLPRGADEADHDSSFGGRLAYVGFQARQKLALVFIPIALLIVQKDLQRYFPDSWKDWQWVVNVGGVATLLAVFVAMPWILRLALGLRPLPAGPLRDRLLAAAHRLHFRCNDILLWNTRNGMANAMVVGIVPGLRYVVFTDRLIEDFTEDEIEAVFGHEVGHVHYHHIPYYLGFLLLSFVLLFYLPALLKKLNDGLRYVDPTYLNELLNLEKHQYLSVFPMMGVLLSYIFVVFGFLSRRCERQADIFGCRAVSCRRPDCRGHEPAAALAPGGRGLCPTGILTFIRALEKVAQINGISRDRPGFLQSWQHSTIARRVEFLERMVLDPSVEPRFQRRVTLIKWALFLALGSALALVVVVSGYGGF